MKAIIDKGGSLFIKRRNRYKPQYCPYCPTDAHCDDSCPLFGEPAYTQTLPIKTKLKLCRTTLYFEEGDFLDERERE